MTLRLAAPAIFLAALLLLPFLNKPYSIDDPLFLREAKHALVDPAHPADFVQVWNVGDRQKLSQYLLGGTLPAYVLAPVAALGGAEWIGHLYQLLLLAAFLLAVVSVACRLGCDKHQASTVALLVAANPVTLGMAATCMPDVMATTFGMWGMDRILAFREQRLLRSGIAAACLFAAALLCRASTAPLLLVAAIYLWPEDRTSAPRYLWPVALAALITAAGLAAVGGAVHSLTSVLFAPRNLVGYLCYQALAGPILLYGLLSQGRRFAFTVAAIAAAGFALSFVHASPNLFEYAIPGAFGLCCVLAISHVAGEWRPQLPLLVWLGSGLIALPYVHMAAKYLLPGVPAAALLIVFHAARERQQRYPLTIALLVAVGWLAGAFIVFGDNALATSQRDAVNHIVAPRIRRGKQVWAGGQWAFIHYAEEAGAQPLANTPPLPQPGDEIVVSRLDYYGKLNQLPIRKELLNTSFDSRCGVFVLNRRFHAGFFSNRFGYLPFAFGCGELNAYDLYRVLPNHVP
jgi:hypothetical protein